MIWKVLIVDDDRLIRESISDILATDNRYQVIMAADGEEAKKLALEESPALIFLDLNLPKVDGWEVCRFVKNSPLTSPNIKVVIITGLIQESVRQKTLQFGPDAIILKPFRPQEIRDVWENLLTSPNGPLLPTSKRR